MRSFTTVLMLLLFAASSAHAGLREGSGGIEFSYSDPGAGSVHLAGDFNEWSTTATPMADADGDGVWTVTVPLGAGSYGYKFVVNGGTWVADPDNPRVTGDFDNSLVEVAADGSLTEARAGGAPVTPSGTPLLSNTPLHGKVYIGGFFRMDMESTTDFEGDQRLRLQRPDDQFNLDVTANLSEKMWGEIRLQVTTGEGGANELDTSLYKAQTNFVERGFEVKAFYNDEVFASGDPLRLLGYADLRGTIEKEERLFGQGQQGAMLALTPWNSELKLLYSDTFDEDIFNPSIPFLTGNEDEAKEGLNQSTGTDVLAGRWTMSASRGRVGLTYRGEFSDWWVNFDNTANPIPAELQPHLDAQVDRADEDKSDNFELARDRQFAALDFSWPVREDIGVSAAAGYGWEEARWALGNKEQLQGQNLGNGKLDDVDAIGNQQLYRGKVATDFERGGFRAQLSHELDYEFGMDAGENQVAYRTQPGSVIQDRDLFASQPIVQRYSDVNGSDSVDILRLGPAPERLSHITEFDMAYGWKQWTLQFEFDRQRDNLDYSLFADTGAGASLDRWAFRASPRLRWQPFENPRHHLSLETEFLQYSNPEELEAIGAASTTPGPTDDDGYGPAQGYGSLLAVESNEFILRGLVPTESVLNVPLDLRFDMRFVDYYGSKDLQDGDGNAIDLNENFFAPFVALVYQPVERVEVQLGYGVDPTFYRVISPEGWPNGRQQWRDDYLIERRLDPYNPINVIQAEDALADQKQVVIHALVTF